MPTIEETISKLEAYKRKIPLLVGNTVIEFIMDNFDREGFQGASFEPWQKRKDNLDPDRNLLIGKGSGRGRRSIRVGRRTESEVTFVAEDYMVLHNTGGTIRVSVTAISRKFFWYMFYATGQEKWMRLALTKRKQLTITIPARPFLKDSPVLDKMIIKVLEAGLIEVFN